MRKAFRHTGVLMMLGVVALGLVGAAYTLWYEELNLNATVKTGPGFPFKVRCLSAAMSQTRIAPSSDPEAS